MSTETNPLENAKKILMLGIGGSGMRGRAAMLAAWGKEIVGTDARLGEIKDDPDLSGFSLVKAEEAVALASDDAVDAIIYTDALLESDPARVAATQSGKPMFNLFEATGLMAAKYKTVAIAGTHGKSTTAALLVHILSEAGKDPSALIGAQVPSWKNQNALIGKSDILIVEADEYLDHFLALEPTYAIITNIDYDHPDFFDSLDDVAASFAEFTHKVHKDGIIVAPAELVSTFETNFNWPAQTQSVSFPKPQIELSLPGAHMQRNAWLAITLAGHLGVATDEAQRHASTFEGLGRRFEKIGDLRGLEIYTDYAHHPAEISVTLMAIVERLPGKRILAVIEPHTQERFEKFFDDYIGALQHAPVGVLLVPIYRARGESTGTRQSSELAAKLAEKRDRVWHINELGRLGSTIDGLRAEFDVIVGLSAGDLDKYIREMAE